MDDLEFYEKAGLMLRDRLLAAKGPGRLIVAQIAYKLAIYLQSRDPLFMPANFLHGVGLADPDIKEAEAFWAANPDVESGWV